MKTIEKIGIAFAITVTFVTGILVATACMMLGWDVLTWCETTYGVENIPEIVSTAGCTLFVAGFMNGFIAVIALICAIYGIIKSKKD